MLSQEINGNVTGNQQQRTSPVAQAVNLFKTEGMKKDEDLMKEQIEGKGRKVKLSCFNTNPERIAA